jgi:hypothetical protein
MLRKNLKQIKKIIQRITKCIIFASGNPDLQHNSKNHCNYNAKLAASGETAPFFSLGGLKKCKLAPSFQWEY